MVNYTSRHNGRKEQWRYCSTDSETWRQLEVSYHLRQRYLHCRNKKTRYQPHRRRGRFQVCLLGFEKRQISPAIHRELHTNYNGSVMNSTQYELYQGRIFKIFMEMKILWSRSEESYRMCVCARVRACLIVCDLETSKWGGLGSSWAAAPQKHKWF